MQHLAAFLSSLSLGPSQSVAGLTVFPLLRQPAPEPWYDTLTEAVAARTARVTEVSDGGRVPELQVVNDESGRVGFSWQIVNQTDTTVCRAKVQLLWRRLQA